MEGRPLDDAELVRRAKDGDVRAYEELVRRHQSIAQRVAYLVVRSVPDAQDATQEAFVKAYRALDRFRGDAPFRPWLLRIVHNEAHNARRRATRQDRLALRAAENPASGDAAPSPEAEVLSESARVALHQAVEGLPEPHRTIISCRFFLGLSVTETAVMLGVAPGTVKSRLNRALSRLRRELPTELRTPEGHDG